MLRNKNNRLCKSFLYADVNLEKILLGKSFIKLQESVSITSLLSKVVKTHCYPSLSIEGGFFASTRKTQTLQNINVNAYNHRYNWSPARLFLPWLVSMYAVCAQCTVYTVARLYHPRTRCVQMKQNVNHKTQNTLIVYYFTLCTSNGFFLLTFNISSAGIWKYLLGIFQSFSPSYLVKGLNFLMSVKETSCL